MKYFSRLSLIITIIISSFVLQAQNLQNNPKSNHGNKFEQMGIMLADPNAYRTASGAPGANYWQMKADYDIDAQLDEKNLQLNGSEWITYHNNAPVSLDYLWLQLDENQHKPDVESNFFNANKIGAPYTTDEIDGLNGNQRLIGFGTQIESVKDATGKSIPFTINQTMMRIDLATPLMPGKSLKFQVKWHYKIPNRMAIGGRGGYEYFPGDGNYLFTISQWYPRMCVYSDFQGWQNKQFTGGPEFALAFGDFTVRMTVPADYMIAATGECQNYKEVLSPQMYQRWLNAQNASTSIEIATLEEAKKAELNQDKNTKTWVYKAQNVRDFAMGASRKFIWDAMPQMIEGRKVMCMSYYPKESYGLYRKYSTKVVAHTIKTYSKYTIPYPYPVAISVEASNGMEYPMICFNYGRTEPDGTYSEALKYGMLDVIIHEVGHNFFPMIINSDERQWTWMDEGLNTFVEYLTEQEFEPNFPSRRGPAYKITPYMSLPKDQLEPVMTNGEEIIQRGPNAYEKPAVALNILRETIMGRELFDFAFKTYCKRWAFKHPTPADLFRTMEDASAVDLDWFWRGWFYDIDPVDISLDSVKLVKFSNNINEQIVDQKSSSRNLKFYQNITDAKNKQAGIEYAINRDTSLRDFYYFNKESYDPNAKVSQNLEPISDSLYAKYASKWVYELNFTNKGGLVMPLIIQWNFKDGSSEIDRISAFVWRINEHNVTKTFAKNKEVDNIVLDPFLETADIDTSNNNWNAPSQPNRFQLFKEKQAKPEGKRRASSANNPMQKAANKTNN